MKANIKIEAIGFNSANLNRLLPPGMKIPQRYWVAEILGISHKYRFRRKFINGRVDYKDSNSKASRGVFLNYILEPGRIYEVSKPTSWKCTERFFATVDNSGAINKHESYEDAKKATG